MGTDESVWELELAPDWRPPQADTALPHPHRMYDHLIGGKANYQVDRDAAEEFVRLSPDSMITVRAMKAFIPRAVVRLATQGITQFLQLGVAIVSPYHGQPVNDQVVRSIQPQARFLYAAEEPVSVARARALIDVQPGPQVAVMQADFRNPAQFLARPEVAEWFDPGRPVGILLICMLDFIADETEAARALGDLYSWAPAGSKIALFHLLHREEVDWTTMSEPVATGCAATQMTMRTPQQLQAVLAAHIHRFEDPGLVPAPQWHPDGTGPGPELGEQAALLAGVIVKPGHNNPDNR
jgi:S-adenosyl methyltransferase